MHGTPCETAAARMRPSSVRAPLPLGVLMISVHFAVDQVIEQVRVPLLELLDQLDLDARLLQQPGGAVGGHQVEAQLRKLAAQVDGVPLGRARPR